jgi:hypothetical protein
MADVLKIGVISGTHTQRVQPGDLITAEFMNALLARLDDIENRLAALEAGSKPTQPTLTFTPTLTFHPTLTFPTTLMPTMTFFPTLTQTFFPTFLTPTLFPTGGLNTFIATLVQPTFGENPTLGFGVNPSIGMSFDPNLGMNVVQPSFSILPAGSAIFHEDTDAGALPGIDKDQRVALSDAGIKTVKDVSTADPKTLAGAMKTTVDNANVMIGIAKNVMGSGTIQR